MTVRAAGAPLGRHAAGTTIAGAPSAARHTLLLGVFLASESVFFLTMIAVYLRYSGATEGGPSLPRLLDAHSALVSTVILVSSSFTMAATDRAARAGHSTRFRSWLFVTIALAVTFLTRQGLEFARLDGLGLGFTRSLQASSFYLLTGVHGAHLVVGLMWLVSLLVVSATRRRAKAEGIGAEMAEIYWHYVDGIWVVLYTLIYVVPALSQ